MSGVIVEDRFPSGAFRGLRCVVCGGVTGESQGRWHDDLNPEKFPAHRAGCEIAAYLAQIAELRAEVDEDDRLRGRLEEILTETAAALKGPPPPLTMHDWSDLPAVAREMRGELESCKYKIEFGT